MQQLLQARSKTLKEWPQRQPHCHTSIYLLWKGVSRDPISFVVLIWPHGNICSRKKRDQALWGQDKGTSYSECLKQGAEILSCLGA